MYLRLKHGGFGSQPSYLRSHWFFMTGQPTYPTLTSFPPPNAPAKSPALTQKPTKPRQGSGCGGTRGGSRVDLSGPSCWAGGRRGGPRFGASSGRAGDALRAWRMDGERGVTVTTWPLICKPCFEWPFSGRGTTTTSQEFRDRKRSKNHGC